MSLLDNEDPVAVARQVLETLKTHPRLRTTERDVANVDRLARQRAEQLTRETTHGPNCWAWGPRHYECALDEIKKLHKAAQAERCEDCSCELSYCGDMTEDGPALDCLPCRQLDTIESLQEKLDSLIHAINNGFSRVGNERGGFNQCLRDIPFIFRKMREYFEQIHRAAVMLNTDPSILEETLEYKLAEFARVQSGLKDAATSLNTISTLAGKDPYLEDLSQILGYAHSREIAALEKLNGVDDGKS